MTFAVLASPLLLISCNGKANESQKTGAELHSEPPELVAERKAALEMENAKIAAIAYPNCGAVWKGEHLTACGTKRLKKALEGCDKIYGTGMRLDSRSAGDSWIARAGTRSTETAEERAPDIKKGDLMTEDLSYALGDGTPAIAIVHCYLKDDVTLSFGVSSIE